MKELTVIKTKETATLRAISSKAKNFIRKAKNRNSLLAYESDWLAFKDFCQKGKHPLLPSTVNTVIEFVAYLAEEKKLKGSTISRKLSAIKWMHEMNQMESPTNNRILRETVRGTKRNLDESNPYRQSKALTLDLILGITGIIPENQKGKRDKLIFLLGFAGALRRDELKNLKVKDLEFIKNDLSISVRNSKTSKDGELQKVAILNGKLKIVDKVREYIKDFNLSGENYLFFAFDRRNLPTPNSKLNSVTLNRIVKKWSSQFGLDEKEVSFHGLRRGYITEALNRGATLARIQTHSRHKNPAMVMRYAQDREKFKDHSGESFL